jgi:hypothetical protein
VIASYTRVASINSEISNLVETPPFLSYGMALPFLLSRNTNNFSAVMSPRDEMDDDDGIDDDNDKCANLPIANYTTGTIILPSIILHNGYSAPSLAGNGHINTVIAERMQVVVIEGGERQK